MTTLFLHSKHWLPVSAERITVVAFDEANDPKRLRLELDRERRDHGLALLRAPARRRRYFKLALAEGIDAYFHGTITRRVNSASCSTASGGAVSGSGGRLGSCDLSGE